MRRGSATNRLYRVNDPIYSAQIEGDKLGPPTPVVKNDDVPEVHWVFWSKVAHTRRLSRSG
jgi:hypothetical protein